MMRGGCLCGAVRFTAQGPFRPVITCHCTTCRNLSGHHVAATSAPRDTVNIEGTVTWYHGSTTARRGFCGTCGAPLFFDGPGDNLSIHAGALDAPTGLRLAGHIFCAEAGDCYDIGDDLPRREGADPILTTMTR